MSYDVTLPTDRDWVRFLIADTDTANERLADGEIDAVLAEEANKWLAAAVCGERMLARSGGLSEKQVDDLRLTWADDKESAFRAALCALRERGARETLTTGSRRSHVFRIV